MRKREEGRSHDGSCPNFQTRAGRDYIRAWERENNTEQQFTGFCTGHGVKENDGVHALTSVHELMG